MTISVMKTAINMGPDSNVGGILKELGKWSKLLYHQTTKQMVVSACTSLSSTSKDGVFIA